MSVLGVEGEERDDFTKAESRLIRDRSVRLLGSLLRPLRLRVTLTIAVVIASTAAQVAGPALIAYGIDAGLPALLRQDWLPLSLAVAAYLTTGIVGAILIAWYTVLSARISQAILIDLRKRVFLKTQKLSLQFHETYTSGRIISRQTSDLDSIRELLDEGINQLVQGGLYMVFIAVALFSLDPVSGLVLFGSLVPLAFLFRWFQRALADAVPPVAGGLGQGDRALRRDHDRHPGGEGVPQGEAQRGRVRRAGRGLPGCQQPRHPAVRLLRPRSDPHRQRHPRGRAAGRRAAGGRRLAGDRRAAGDPAVHAAVLRPGRGDGDVLQLLPVGGGGAGEDLRACSRSSRACRTRPARSTCGRPRARSSFDGVEFAYAGGKVVLPKFSLDLPAGQTIALVGSTGAGKSTLAKLVSRFYDPSEGTVSLDGVDLRRLHPKDLRRAIVMVTQEAYLFSGSVADNIALGKPEASRDEIVAAAHAVGAHEFISSLPNGYDTDVNKRGGRVSAGQRQLISFARAFLADPVVLILDEATASLDIPSERLVQQGLQTLLADRTAIIIAHRLSTVAIADRVLVMEHGRIVEDGTPADLIAGDRPLLAAARRLARLPGLTVPLTPFQGISVSSTRTCLTGAG